MLARSGRGRSPASDIAQCWKWNLGARWTGWMTIGVSDLVEFISLEYLSPLGTQRVYEMLFDHMPHAVKGDQAGCHVSRANDLP
jgi:hypothetical protein